MSQNLLEFPLRLLIADSDEQSLQELRDTLENAGYAVVAAEAKGAQAIQSARELRPDVVLLSTDSVTAADTLYQERIAPVVLLTEAAERELAARAVGAGVFSCLARPVREASLIPAIELARHQWQLVREQERKIQRLTEKEETREIIECAKKALMESCGFTEVRAHRFIQGRSMNTRRPIRDVAEAILLTHSTLHGILSDSYDGLQQEAA